MPSTIGAVGRGARCSAPRRPVPPSLTRPSPRYLHVDSEETNNFFSVTFATPPPDSSGVPHVLEHVVLCGSERYPVRDPFFHMLKRSCNTFMNALTYSMNALAILMKVRAIFLKALAI